jgi:hypothetical protein
MQAMPASRQWVLRDGFRYPKSTRYVVPFPAARACERLYGTPDDLKTVWRWYRNRFPHIHMYNGHSPNGGFENMLMVGNMQTGTGIFLNRHFDITYAVVGPAWELAGLDGDIRTCKIAAQRTSVREATK